LQAQPLKVCLSCCVGCQQACKGRALTASLRALQGRRRQGIVEDPGGLSLRGAAEAAAPDVLSDEGQARFAAMQYRAPTPQQFAAPETGPTAPNDVLQSASEALDAQATEAATQAEDLRTGAQRALTAEDRGFGPESGVAPERHHR
jgi:hypothetical protein